MRPPWAAVAAVMLGVCGAFVHGLVPAPQNVTVQCSDHKPRVFWNYSSETPTEFTVQLDGSGKHSEAKTLNHEFDLRDFVWQSETQMLEYLVVYITAVQEAKRSAPSPSPSFSYNMYKTVHVTCNLTFPPGELSKDKSGATLTLENPLLVYEELKTIKGSVISVFTKNKPTRCEDKVCRVPVDLPEGSSCVNVSGTIKRGQESIRVLHPGPVCLSGGGDGGLWLVAGLSVAVFVFVIVGLTVAIWKSRAWIFPKVPTPQTLILNPQKERVSALPSETVCSPVQIIGSRPRFGLEAGTFGVLEAEEVLPEDLQDDESAESNQTETISIHSSSSEEIEVSNYERRPMLVDFDDDGDMVTGYLS